VRSKVSAWGILELWMGLKMEKAKKKTEIMGLGHQVDP